MLVRSLRHRAAIATVAAAASALLFTGCVGNPLEGVVERGVEDAVEGATGGDVSLSGELPEGFPESVPLIDGDIAFAAGTDGVEGWIVAIVSTASNPVGDAVAALEDAGFAEDAALSGASGGAKILSDGAHVVLVAAEGDTVTYTVTPAQQ